MTEDEVRRIVREEIAEWERDRVAKSRAAGDQFRAEWAEMNAPNPNDPPLVAEMKRAIRGEDT